MRDLAQVIDDLRCQLACGRQHQCALARVGALQALDQRDAERERLARPGRGLRQHVVPGKHVGNDHLLDGERRLDPALGEFVCDNLGHAEVGERFMMHVGVAPSGGLPAAAADGDSTDPIRALRAPTKTRTSRTTSPPVG